MLLFQVCYYCLTHVKINKKQGFLYFVSVSSCIEGAVEAHHISFWRGVDSGMLKALIVDDEALTRDVLENYIPWLQLGITGLMTAEDGLQAVQIASEFKPDIILCDIRMPGMNGIKMAESIREFIPDCRFIFLSAYTDKEYLKSAIRLKAINYVEKPLVIDEIVSALNRACDEIKLEREKNAVNNLNLHEKLCLYLISSPESRDMQKNKVVPEFELPPDNSYVASALYCKAKYSESGAIDTELMEKMHGIIIENHRTSSGRILMSYKGDEHLVILFKLDRLHEQAFIIDFINRIITEINDSFPGRYDVYAGIGREVKGKENIYISYQTAVISMKKCFFAGSPQSYIDDNSPVYVFDKQILSTLSNHLKNGRFNDAVLCVRRLGIEIQKHSNTPIYDVKSIFMNMLLVLLRFSEDHNLSLLKKDYASVLKEITAANFLKDIINCITFVIEAMARELNENSIHSDAILKISDFVNKNYFDNDLSIITISKSVFLSPNYLSLLFKEKTGKTINQYITEVRMENAKRLLNNSDSSITEIANRVGYGDPKYFAKVFRKMVGINPSEYRGIHSYENVSDE